MLFTSKLASALSLAFFATAVFTAPIPDDELDPEDVAFGAQGNTPALPSVQDCKDHLNIPSDTTLFYSGPGGYAKKAKDKIKNVDALKNYKILSQMWTDPKWQDQWQNDEQASKDFFNICSQAVAEASSGTAYVLLPPGKGTDWKKGTVWDGYEWPNLGSGVTKVIRINPDNTDEEVIKGGSAAPTSDPAPAPPAPPAFAPGICSFHLAQWDYALFDDTDGNKRYQVEVRLLDNNKAQIGFQPKTPAGDANPLAMTSQLPLTLVVTPEAQGDYIQFAYGAESWDTKTNYGANDMPRCSVGDYDGSDYPPVSVLGFLGEMGGFCLFCILLFKSNSISTRLTFSG